MIRRQANWIDGGRAYVVGWFWSLADRFAPWLAASLVGWLAGWFARWLANSVAA